MSANSSTNKVIESKYLVLIISLVIISFLVNLLGKPVNELFVWAMFSGIIVGLFGINWAYYLAWRAAKNSSDVSG